MTKRPSYRYALAWLASNDDCHWLADDDSIERLGIRPVVRHPDLRGRRIERIAAGDHLQHGSRIIYCRTKDADTCAHRHRPWHHH